MLQAPVLGGGLIGGPSGLLSKGSGSGLLSGGSGTGLLSGGSGSGLLSGGTGLLGGPLSSGLLLSSSSLGTGLLGERMKGEKPLGTLGSGKTLQIPGLISYRIGLITKGAGGIKKKGLFSGFDSIVPGSNSFGSSSLYASVANEEDDKEEDPNYNPEDPEPENNLIKYPENYPFNQIITVILSLWSHSTLKHSFDLSNGPNF